MAKAGIVYAGTDDGLVIFSDPGGIGRWRQIGHTLNGHAVRAMLAQSALDVLVSAEGAGLQHSADGGQTWQQVLAAEVAAVAAHPDAPEALLAITMSSEILQSLDSGQTWQHVAQFELPADAAPLLYAAAAVSKLFILAIGGVLYTSLDGGATWTPYGAAFSEPITSLVASPGRAEVLFAVAGGLIHRACAEGTWEQIEPLAGGTGYRIALAMLTGQQEILLAAFSTWDSIMFARSDNDGTSWQIARVSASLGGQVTVIEPASYHMDTAWAGTRAGQLLRSDDRGRTWEQIAQVETAIRSLAMVRLA